MNNLHQQATFEMATGQSFTGTWQFLGRVRGSLANYQVNLQISDRVHLKERKEEEEEEREKRTSARA